MKRVGRGIAPLFLLLPSASWALGLGDIRVETALNEPLLAEIPVLSASKKDLRDMKVRLAPKAAFDKLGLDRSYVLTQLRFTPTTVNGRPVIRVTSRKPIREPFLDFLIEVNWPKGRLVREYTVLLDPPSMLDRQVSPQVESPRTAGAAPTYRFEQPASPASAYDGPRVTAGGPGSVEVRPGDTLYEIARRLAPEVGGADLNQIMLALYQANPQAFGGNMNLLRAGARLRVPSAAEVAAVDAAAARAEVARQTEQWRAGRALASAPEPEPDEEVLAAPQTTQTAAVPGPAPMEEEPLAEPAEAAPQASAEPDETEGRLEIVAGDAAEGSIAGGGEPGAGAAAQAGDMETSLALAREVAKAREEENAALKSRLAQLEEMLKRSERIIELQNRELEALRERIARLEAGVVGEPSAAAPSVAVESAGPGEAEVAGAADTERGAAPVSVQASSEPVGDAPEADADKPYSTLDVLMNNPLVLYGAGGGGVLLLLLTLLALRRRREESDEVLAEAAPTGTDVLPTGALATGTMPAAGVAATRETAEAISTGMFEAAQTVAATQKEPDLEDTQQIAPEDLAARGGIGGAAPAEAEDVLSEADVYIAYGLYQQAEELLQEALEQDPGNAEFYVKLAEAYQREGRPEALAKLAERMREAGLGEGQPWERLAALGRKVEPDNPLYAGAGSPQPEAPPEEKEVDLDLGEEIPEAADATAWDLDTGALRPEGDEGEALPTGFSEAVDMEPAAEGETRPGEESGPAAEGDGDSHILEFDAEDLGLRTGSMENPEEAAAETDPGGLTEEIQGDLDTSTDLDLDLTDVELRRPEGLEQGGEEEAPSPEETIELDESLLQELESAISEIQDSAVFEEPPGEEDAGEQFPSDTLLLEDESLQGAETEVVARPSDGVEDVLDIDTLMGDDAKMTFEVEAPPGEEREASGERETELIDTSGTSEETSDTLVTDSGFTNLVSDTDEAETKLELARAYLEMGDKEGARATLEEVLESASDEHRRKAEALLRTIG